MRSALFAAGLLALCIPTRAQSPEAPGAEPFRIEGMAPWGSITRVMEPEYPQALKDAKAKVHIDISGRVTYYGELVDVIYTPGSDEAKLMVEPLRAVIKHWTFITPTDSECQPTGVVVKNRVWFEFDEEKPKLSVTRAPSELPPSARSIKTVKRVSPTFPREMQRRGWQSWVYTRVAIDPEGKVVEVIAHPYPKQDGIDLSPFVKESIRALSQWTFNPAPEAQRSRHACYPVFFRLTG